MIKSSSNHSHISDSNVTTTNTNSIMNSQNHNETIFSSFMTTVATSNNFINKTEVSGSNNSNNNNNNIHAATIMKEGRLTHKKGLLNSQKKYAMLCAPKNIDDIKWISSRLFPSVSSHEPELTQAMVICYGHLTYASLQKSPVFILLNPDQSPTTANYIHFEDIINYMDEREITQACYFEINLLNADYRFKCKTSTDYQEWISSISSAYTIATKRQQKVPSLVMSVGSHPHSSNTSLRTTRNTISLQDMVSKQHPSPLGMTSTKNNSLSHPQSTILTNPSPSSSVSPSSPFPFIGHNNNKNSDNMNANNNDKVIAAATITSKTITTTTAASTATISNTSNTVIPAPTQENKENTLPYLHRLSTNMFDGFSKEDAPMSVIAEELEPSEVSAAPTPTA